MIEAKNGEKLQNDINRAAAEISALSSGKINEYEYLAGREILPPQQHKIIQEAKFSYSLLGRHLKNKKRLLKSR